MSEASLPTRRSGTREARRRNAEAGDEVTRSALLSGSERVAEIGESRHRRRVNREHEDHPRTRRQGALTSSLKPLCQHPRAAA